MPYTAAVQRAKDRRKKKSHSRANSKDQSQRCVSRIVVIGRKALEENAVKGQRAGAVKHRSVA